MIKKLLPCLVFLFSFQFALGQAAGPGVLPNYDSPSPEASALGKYIEHPVSYYTGTPKIEIPLFEIKTGRITVPISISYHASGVKVDEIASRVGTGWTLNAGGVIAQIVKGWPDDVSANGVIGYFNHDKIIAGEQAGDIIQRYDLEPDAHYYNFGSKKGIIYFRNRNIALPSNNEPMKIKGPYDGSNRFMITTDDGLVYKFEASETTSNSSYSYKSYYLTEISDPIAGKWVKFTYRTDMPYIYYSTKRFTSTNLSCTMLGGGTIYPATSINQIKVLQKIEYNDGYIEFKADHSRQDFPGDRAYTEINQYVKDLDIASFKKGYNLSYAYTSTGSTAEGKRLYLESIKEKGTDGSFLPPYQFSYKNRDALPARNSYQLDVWGFYNANGQTTESLPKLYIYPTFFHGYCFPFPAEGTSPNTVAGTDRAGNPLTIDYGVLNKVIYPTKGYTTYDYEPHVFSHNSMVFKQGGIRIKDIKDFAPNGDLLLHKNYFYSGGALGGPLPQVGLLLRTNSYFRFDQNQALLGSCNGSYVGYGYVEEMQKGQPDVNGRTAYYYSTDKDVEGSFIVNSNACNDLNNLSDIRRTSSFPFFAMESRENRRGVLLKQAFYKGTTINQGTQPFKEIIYNYDLFSHPITTVYSSYILWDINTYHQANFSGSRQLNQEKMLLVSKQEIDYTATGNVANKLTTYEYTYGAYEGKFLRSVTNHGKEDIQTTYYYPFDYARTASNGVMGKMVDAYYISPVINEVKTKILYPQTSNPITYYTEGKITNYGQTYTSYIVPKEVYTLNSLVPIQNANEAIVADPANPGTKYEKQLEYIYNYNAVPSAIKYNDRQADILIWTTWGDRLLAKYNSSREYLTTIPYPPQSWEKTPSTNSKTGSSEYFYTNYYWPFPFYVVGGNPTYISFWAKGGTFSIEVTDSGDYYQVSDTAPADWKYYSFVLPTDTHRDWEGSNVYLTGTARLNEVYLTNDGVGKKTYYGYDRYNRLKYIMHPDGNMENYEYDAFSRLVNVKDQNGKIIKRTEYHYQNQ